MLFIYSLIQNFLPTQSVLDCGEYFLVQINRLVNMSNNYRKKIYNLEMYYDP